MKIQVLGPGCAKCIQTEKIVREAVEQSGVTAQVIKVTDIMEMMNLGVMSTPAVIIDGKIVCSGRVPTHDQVIGWMKGAIAADSVSCSCSCGCSR